MTGTVKRNRQWLRTRSALLAAGEELFAERPVEAVTVDQIVAAADVAKGSFYNHFEDKDGLAKAVHDRVQEDIETGVARLNAGVVDPAERIARSFCWFIDYARSRPQRLQTILRITDERTVADSPLNVRLSAEILDAITQGRAKIGDVQSAILVMTGLSRATLTYLMTEGRAESAQDLAASMGEAMLRALGMEGAEARQIAGRAVQDIISD